MGDIASWSFPIGRISGIAIRIHLLFLFFFVAVVARGMAHGYAAAALIVQVLLFLSVLLHEFGHCAAARWMDGDANEVLLWPLGGLAKVDIPNTPRAHLVTTLGGPAVNVVLCGLSAAALAAGGLVPPIDPFYDVITPGPLTAWSDGRPILVSATGAMLARLFWVNWLLFWFNMLLVGFPMDAGRVLQSVLWPHVGYRRATMAAVYAGYGVAVALVLFVWIVIGDNYGPSMLMLLLLALFIFSSCRQQAQLLEMRGLGDDTLFGYDFSQGYTSLEQEAPAVRRRRRPNFIQRWRQRRAIRKRQREERQRLADERRVDDLLAKVQRGGLESLTEEERRFLTRVSSQYRNRGKS